MAERTSTLSFRFTRETRHGLRVLAAVRGVSLLALLRQLADEELARARKSRELLGRASATPSRSTPPARDAAYTLTLPTSTYQGLRALASHRGVMLKDLLQPLGEAELWRARQTGEIRRSQVEGDPARAGGAP